MQEGAEGYGVIRSKIITKRSGSGVKTPVERRQMEKGRKRKTK